MLRKWRVSIPHVLSALCLPAIGSEPMLGQLFRAVMGVAPALAVPPLAAASIDVVPRLAGKQALRRPGGRFQFIVEGNEGFAIHGSDQIVVGRAGSQLPHDKALSALACHNAVTELKHFALRFGHRRVRRDWREALPGML